MVMSVYETGISEKGVGDAEALFEVAEKALENIGGE